MSSLWVCVPRTQQSWVGSDLPDPLLLKEFGPRNPRTVHMELLGFVDVSAK